ncbi:hypothetical protein [Shewanella algae]|nr:hypothetical protein [Shewanella algae]
MSQPRTQTLLCHKEVNDGCLKPEWRFHRSRKALATINIEVAK